MYKIRFYKNASLNYYKIFEYISQDNLFYANKVLKNIDETIDMLIDFPNIWKKLNNNHRIIIEPQYKYKIVYRIENEII